MAKRSNRPGLRTTAIHAGETPDAETGASAPNLVMSTTYALERPRGFSIHAIGDDAPYIYTRWSNPTVRQLEDKLAALEGAEACQAFASGMAASAGLLLSLLSSGDHLVISDTNYAGTAELARHTLPRLGIEVTAADTSDVDAVAAALRANTKLLWIETPANPILRLSDIRALAELAHGAGARLAVDSTFATPVATRPIELGADFVVHSLTKYIGGHGDALGGAVLGSAADIQALNREAAIHHGGVLSPFNAWLILRGAATLPLRMKAHSESALAVAEFLESHPKVARVLYPGLASHPQHDLARRQMDSFSGMMAFQVADGPATAARMAARTEGGLRVIHYAVSLGHHRSLIYWIGTDEVVGASFALEGAQLDAYRAFAGDGVFRLSVGLEDPEDICADLDRVL
jgi:methionine-gamma-lyase